MKDITLDKKYTTVNGLEVKLYDIIELPPHGFTPAQSKVFGAINIDGTWSLSEWALSGRRSIGCYVSNYDLVEVWEPKHDELVFVWNDGARYPNVRRFRSMHAQGYYLCESRKGDKYHYRNGYRYCAPFDTTLPKELV